MCYNFKDKTIIVTGGSRGIGKAIAKNFAKSGGTVFVWDYILPDENDFFETDSNLKENVFFQQVDVSNIDSVNSAYEETIRKGGKIDILVNNAGITRDNLLIRMSEEEWDSVLSTNLKGTYLCTKAVISAMIKQRWGRIINISSIVGEIGNAGQANYSASKAGIIGFTKSLAKEVASRNILVNAVAPGYIRTPMTDKLTEEQKENFLKNIPLRKIGEPDDVAKVVLFLASEESSYITGQVINVDGGLVM
ncbi:MAG: 3-oxoacyl-[acyl-carrier-protein] reductase [Ignavibacteria bacterium]|nr:3-oxoacyl-[acyl-carrier-protein] reductase [Ignavibacteria bacterium]